MFPPAQLAAVLGAAKLASAHGPWSRAVGYRNLLSPPPGLTGPPQPLWGGAGLGEGRLAQAEEPERPDSVELGVFAIRAFLIVLPGRSGCACERI